jgi:RimJ/RimL family protein N-acetyltransferase
MLFQSTLASKLQDYVFRKGAYRDYKVYSILRREHRSK